MARDVFNKYAADYQNKFMDVELYAGSLDLFCKNISRKHAAILEVACGPGNITRYLLKKRPDFQILGTDIASNMLELARQNNPTAEFQLMDCKDISRLAKTYDGIVSGFCFPYLSKEEAIQFIVDASALLNAKGILYLSTMEDDYEKSGLKGASMDANDKTYTYYHQADYLESALKENAFILIDIQRKMSIAKDGTKTTDLLILAEKC